MNLSGLKKEIPYQWRVQSTFSDWCTCVAYIDARDAMDLLDEVVGPENWQSKYELINNVLFCHVSIKIGDEWVTKSDCGTESNTEKEKGQASDAFKRACVHWGVGRFLYDLDLELVPYVDNGKGKKYPAKHQSHELLKNGKDLTKYINQIKKSKNK